MYPVALGCAYDKNHVICACSQEQMRCAGALKSVICACTQKPRAARQWHVVRNLAGQIREVKLKGLQEIIRSADLPGPMGPSVISSSHSGHTSGFIFHSFTLSFIFIFHFYLVSLLVFFILDLSLYHHL
jgi:hypothetical protein